MDPPFITLVAGGMQAKSSELLPSSENVLGSSVRPIFESI
jgi:hypothetical protein